MVSHFSWSVLLIFHVSCTFLSFFYNAYVKMICMLHFRETQRSTTANSTSRLKNKKQQQRRRNLKRGVSSSSVRQLTVKRGVSVPCGAQTKTSRTEQQSSSSSSSSLHLSHRFLEMMMQRTMTCSTRSIKPPDSLWGINPPSEQNIALENYCYPLRKKNNVFIRARVVP